MKKFFLLAFFALVFSVCANAQINDSNLRKGMTYDELKGMYNPAEYVKDIYDPYNPGLCGVCSFLIPGLGQILEEETMRGLSFFGAAAGAGIVYGVGSAMVNKSYWNGSSALQIAGYVLELGGAVGLLAIDIYSIVDAVKVGKVKNMYNQDLRKLMADKGIDINLRPSLAYVPTANGMAPSAGLSMTVSF